MKVRTVIVLMVIVISFLLVGCQTVVRTNWEYNELSIRCNRQSANEYDCQTYDSDDSYPDRVSILDNYGKLGWEVISEIADGDSVHYLLKRPLLQ